MRCADTVRVHHASRSSQHNPAGQATKDTLLPAHFRHAMALHHQIHVSPHHVAHVPCSPRNEVVNITLQRTPRLYTAGKRTVTPAVTFEPGSRVAMRAAQDKVKRTLARHPWAVCLREQSLEVRCASAVAALAQHATQHQCHAHLQLCPQVNWHHGASCAGMRAARLLSKRQGRRNVAEENAVSSSGRKRSDGTRTGDLA
jgi:hypothetical protein